MVISESKGSSPGRKGFKMAVSSDGELVGSIGGGSMEHRLVELCKEMLQRDDYKVFLKKEIHHDNSNSPSGMICSGNQTVAFFPIQADQTELAQRIVAAIAAQQGLNLLYSRHGIALIEKTTKEESIAPFSADDEDWTFTEVPGMQSHVFIVGGGHVSLALSQILSILDFQVTVFDNREHVNTYDANVFAHEKHRVEYDQIARFIPEGANVMVVVMTQFHSSDLLVLKQLAGKKLGYLGMMGSKSKVKTIFQKLENEGVSHELLQKVYAPIGIEIGSQTPEEIAVSIVAELITVKNRNPLLP